ncbi:hypothetical protein LPJ66_011014, partial [Kickxella alabastrina]
MVRFGTNTQKSNEPAWQDVGANVLRMDSLYDASFHNWLKCEDNVTIIASYLQRIANEYPMDRIINALRWLVSSWRLESTVVIVRHITADWALPKNPPKPTASMPFRLDTHSASLQSDPAVLSGEGRRGVLVRELTKDWSSQQIAQLVGMLALTFWSERTHLEAFLRTLVSDWDFCRLSSFFSYVSGQLGLDYRMKVSMLQQAARRNASRLSVKRARNGGPNTKKSADGSNDDDSSNKRMRQDTLVHDAEDAESSPVASAMSSSLTEVSSEREIRPDSAAVTPAAAAASTAAAAASSIIENNGSSGGAQQPVLLASTHISAAATASAVTLNGAATASAVVNAAASTSFRSIVPSPRAAAFLAARGSRIRPIMESMRPARPSLLQFDIQAASAMHRSAAAVVGAATTPSSPADSTMSDSPSSNTSALLNRISSQPSSSSMEVDSEEIQSSSSSTDLASMPYAQQQQQQHQQQQQQRRRLRNNTSGATVAPSSASSPLVASSSTEHTAEASSTAGASSSSSNIVSRRPLTPQISSSVFIVGSDSHPSSPNLRQQHRHNHSYQYHDCPQPLTPAHTSSGLSIIGSSGDSASSGSSTTGSVPNRPAMRIHAASLSSAN